MIRRRDGEWLPFYRRNDQWVVGLSYRIEDGRHAIGHSVPSKWRLVALWNGLRTRIDDDPWRKSGVIR